MRRRNVEMRRKERRREARRSKRHWRYKSNSQDPSEQEGYDVEVEKYKRMPQGGSGADRTVIVDYYNIIEFGSKAKEWLASNEGKKAEVIGLGEHHLRGKSLMLGRDWAQQQGWRSTWTQASWSGRSEKGTSGGVAMFSKKHLHLSSMIVHRQGGDTVSELKGQDWIALPLKLRGITVLFVAAYMTHGVGVGGANIRKMSGIMEAILKLQLPFIIMADWNMEPQELKGRGFMEKLGADS